MSRANPGVYANRAVLKWGDEVTAEWLREHFDWSWTKPDMRDRVVRAIEMQAETIVACCGPFLPETVVAYCDLGQECPLDAGCFSLRSGMGDVEDEESVVGVPKEILVTTSIYGREERCVLMRTWDAGTIDVARLTDGRCFRVSGLAAY